MGVHPGGVILDAEDELQQHLHRDKRELPAKDDGRPGQQHDLRPQCQQGLAGIGDNPQRGDHHLYLQREQRPSDPGAERQLHCAVYLRQGPSDGYQRGELGRAVCAELRRPWPPDHHAGGAGDQSADAVHQHVEHAGPADENDLRQRRSDQLCL